MLHYSNALMSILRQSPTAPMEDRGEYEVVASNIRCVVSSPSGDTRFSAERTDITSSARLISDVCYLNAGDRVEIGADTYDVVWAESRINGPTEQVNHTVAAIQKVI